MKVKVIARQWSWLFEYENGTKSTELKVPVGKPVKLSLTSQDVIHGFYAPAFRIKQDVVPGMTNTLWFQPTEVGHGMCFVPSIADFSMPKWSPKSWCFQSKSLIHGIKKEGKKWRRSRGNLAGLNSFQEKGCMACHSMDGTPRVGHP